ncbi:hypothetical protein EXS74_03805 [Candidatus Woesearchaeota archaeon]|nr:hypothetical protein [Candidatus Woesearchaeota archaeon]
MEWVVPGKKMKEIEKIIKELEEENRKEIQTIQSAGIYASLALTNILPYFASHIIGNVTDNPTLENNIGDSFLAASGYFIFRIFFKGETSLAVAIAGPSLLEGLQQITNQGYDPKDFAAYVIGAGLAYTLDQLCTKREQVK